MALDDVADRLTRITGALVKMKLTANRDQDRVHLRDLIDVGLVERDLLTELPEELAVRLKTLLDEAGR